MMSPTRLCEELSIRVKYSAWKSVCHIARTVYFLMPCGHPSGEKERCLEAVL